MGKKKNKKLKKRLRIQAMSDGKITKKEKKALKAAGVSPKKINKLVTKTARSATTEADKDGSLTKKELRQISRTTGASPKKISKAAKATQATLPKKGIKKIVKTSQARQKTLKLIKKDEGDLNAKDILRISKKTGLKPGKIGKIAGKKTDKVIKEGAVSKAKVKFKADKAASNVDPIPRAEDGRNKPFKKYKPQATAIRKAAKAELDVKKEEGFAPKRLKGAGKIKKDFLAGRDDREKRMAGIEEKAKRPSYSDYEANVNAIKKGEGAAASYAYSGKFKDLGKKLGVDRKQG